MRRKATKISASTNTANRPEDLMNVTSACQAATLLETLQRLAILASSRYLFTAAMYPAGQYRNPHLVCCSLQTCYLERSVLGLRSPTSQQYRRMPVKVSSNYMSANSVHVQQGLPTPVIAKLTKDCGVYGTRLRSAWTHRVLCAQRVDEEA